MPLIDPAAACPDPEGPVHAFNAPTHKPGPVPARFQRPDRPEIPGEFPGIWGKKAQPRSLDRRAEWSFLEPIWERPAGPILTRAEQVES
jgi:hypothetical protein